MQKRLQSAMEYLMTYGWAILSIAVVLTILYYLGFFSSQPIPTGCIAEPGFYCQNLVYSAQLDPSCGAPYVTANLGIIGTQSWSNAYFVIVPYGQHLTDNSIADETNPDDFFYWGSLYGSYGWVSSLSSGQVSSVTICISPGGKLAVGSQLTGAIWAMYTTPTTTNALTEVAQFSASSTRP